MVACVSRFVSVVSVGCFVGVAVGRSIVQDSVFGGNSEQLSIWYRRLLSRSWPKFVVPRAFWLAIRLVRHSPCATFASCVKPCRLARTLPRRWASFRRRQSFEGVPPLAGGSVGRQSRGGQPVDLPRQVQPGSLQFPR